MKIKHLQLNTSILRDPNSVIEFINKNNIDIVCLQEISYPIGKECPLNSIKDKNYNYIEGINYYNLPKNVVSAEAILTKYKILDTVKLYFNSPNYQPNTITKVDGKYGTTFNDSSKNSFPGSRGIKNSIKPRCILSSLLKTPSGLIRVIVTHYNVSDLCTETIQMYQMSEQINSLVANSKDYPTIFSGDLNIRAESYSVYKLKEVLTCHTDKLKNTLSKKHISKKDFPKGLAIDHVFSKGLKHNSTQNIEISFSDHNAIISEFEL